jgi:hypothetical protein
MAATDKARFKKLLEEIRQKYSLPELRLILKSEELGTAPGWEQLADRFAEAEPVLKAKAERILKEVHGDLILGGTKDVQIFELPPGEGALIAAALGDLEPSSTNFGATYPLSLSETELRALTSDHELTAKVKYKNGDVSLVFCAKRTVEEQVRYKSSEVTKAVRDAFAGYEEFIAIRRMDYQIFDVLTVRSKLNRVELLVDYPDRIRLPESTDARVLGLLGRVSMLVPALKIIYEKNEPINLLACINNLLQAKTEGRVSRLHFRSPTDSIKKEAMTANKDLRVEVFHAAGVQAVGAITPFDITVAWEKLLKAKGAVSVRVGAPISVLSSDGALVRTARIFGARSDAAVLAVVNKLVSYST